MRYVAMGDSYTIGTAVAEADRWPNLLVDRIDQLELVANIAVDGATSRDVVEEQLPHLDRFDPELVTVLVGTNDAVQGIPDSEYASNVTILLEELLARLPAERIACVASPDLRVIAVGDDPADPARASDALVRLNAILREACDGRGIRFVPEIFEISQEEDFDRSLLADDDFHPSARQYARWVDVIEPVVRELLEGRPTPASIGGR